MQEKPVSLLPTSWLADRLGLSVTTIERLRSKKSPDLPPHVLIGKSIRYDEAVVERWLDSKMQFILAQEEKDNV
jgi:predicted DNA-binding transcriptional regulator AlpA